jgi:hypothetical protein
MILELRSRRARFGLSVGLGAAGLLVLAQCLATSSDPQASAARASGPSGAEAWGVVYEVLQHPRCMNCHPVGDSPLQGDQSLPHVQGVKRGPDGHGFYAMRCDTCHQTTNLEAPHLPPGAPNWHLPSPDMPLVFEGVSSGDLCRQMRDPRTNGGKSHAELEHHMTQDALVLWGWDPGPGRAPVSTPQRVFAEAARTWIASGCDCPE